VQAADEVDTKVSLADPVPDPVETHVRGHRHALGDGVRRDADGDFVVAEQRCCVLPVAHVGQEFPLFRGDACGGVEAGALRFGNKGTDDDRNAGGGGRRWGGRGRRRLIGRVATYPTLGKISDRRDVRLRSLADVEGEPWCRGWERPARMRGHRWHASTVVQQEADRHLQLLGLCRGG
jgi:hypothetical protein